MDMKRFEKNELIETQSATERIFEGRILKVYRDTVLLSDGQESTREIVKVAPAVAIIALQGENLLLVRQYRYAVGSTVLEIPAGRLSPDESPIACAERELREETGYAGRLRSLGHYQMSVGYSDEAIHFFWTTELAWNPLPLDEGEHLEVIAIPWSEALKKATQGEFADSKTTMGILLTHYARTALISDGV